MPPAKKILVTDAHRGNALAVIRSLGRQGYFVIAASCDPSSLGFRSKYAREQIFYPDPSQEPLAFVDRLDETVRQHSIDLIIPVTDEAIIPLINDRQRFQGRCQIAMPETEAFQVVGDKMRTIDLAKKLGVPIPRTSFVVSVEQAVEAVKEFDWPVVLKPQSSRIYEEGDSIRSYKVDYAKNEGELVEKMEEISSPVLLQEFVSGEGCGVEILLHEGRPLAAFQHHRIHEVPVVGGVSSLRESVELDQDLYRHSLAILQELKWTGLAMVEFKVNQDGRAWLMEINGRIWGSIPLAVHAGMDFPSQLAKMYLVGPPSSEVAVDTQYRRLLKSRNLQLEITWVLSVLLKRKQHAFAKFPSRMKAIQAMVALLNPACRDDILCWSDINPGVGLPWQIVKKLFSKMT